MNLLRRRYKRLLFILCILCIVTPSVILGLLRISRPRQYNRMANLNKSQHVNPLKGFGEKSLVVVHLDLKGAPPRMEYLRKLLPRLALQGATGLLVEYEDMFPFTGPLVNISARNCYSASQIRKMISWAHDLGMEVIPLVQTFGHLEFVLKLEEFRHLRELDSFPQELCPSNEASLKLVKEMITQVMALHSGARFLHIGCDEVFHLAACAKCSQRHLTSSEIYGDHVSKVAEFVVNTYPRVVPIIWDDMLRKWPPQLLSDSVLPRLVEPMVWAYSSDVTRLIKQHTWYWYCHVFRRVWMAGAFKGSSGPSATLPDMETHLENQRSWMMMAEKTPVEVAGLVLTGWSRYDHFSVLCELLPVSMPSLALSLAAVRLHGARNQSIFDTWSRALSCPESIKLSLQAMRTDHKILLTCQFLGSELYAQTLHYLLLKSTINSFHIHLTESRGWMTLYNQKYNFSSPFRLMEDSTLLNIRQLKAQLTTFTNSTRNTLLEYFDHHTADEWIDQKVSPLSAKLDSLSEIINRLMKVETWPRRPFR